MAKARKTKKTKTVSRTYKLDPEAKLPKELAGLTLADIRRNAEKAGYTLDIIREKACRPKAQD